MSNAMRAGIVLLAILVLAILLASLRSCESAPETSQGTVEYDNTPVETTVSESIQYPNEYIQYSNEHVEVHSTLPKTGGIKVW